MVDQNKRVDRFARICFFVGLAFTQRQRCSSTDRSPQRGFPIPDGSSDERSCDFSQRAVLRAGRDNDNDDNNGDTGLLDGGADTTDDTSGVFDQRGVRWR